MNKTEFLEYARCPMGCNENDDFVLTGKDRIQKLPGSFPVVRCRACGLMRTNPRPTKERIGLYYPEAYAPYKATKVKNQEAIRERSFAAKTVKQFVQFNSNPVPPMKPGSMLEVGCASGSFLHEMSARGWDVAGIEFSQKAAQNAQKAGLKVFSGPLEEANFAEGAFDMAVGWMVLEHLYDPILALKMLRKWVKPGGSLAISLPNAGSLEFSIFKSRWYALHLPNHLYHFTPRTIARVLHLGGWKTERIFHQRTLSNLIASAGYALEDLGLFPGISHKLATFPEKAALAQYLLYPPAALMAALGQTGRMTVWARRM